MKKIDARYLWIYSIVLFCIALGLVLMSAVNQQRSRQSAEQYAAQLSEQKIFTEGIQENLSALTEQNEYLKKQLDELKEESQKQLDELTGESDARQLELRERLGASQARADSLAALITSLNCLYEHNYDGSRAALGRVDFEGLADGEKALYLRIDEDLKDVGK